LFWIEEYSLALADTGTTSRGGDLVREWSTKRGQLQDDDPCNNDNTEDWDTVAVTVVVVVVVVELAAALEEKPKRRQTRQAAARIIIDAGLQERCNCLRLVVGLVVAVIVS
jgi:hypothetical protein